MKKPKFALTALILSLSLAVFGCTRQTDGAETQNETADPAPSPEAARAAELEATLAKQQETQYMQERDYQARIAALEAELAAKNEPQPAAPEEETALFHYEIKDGAAVITGYEGTAAFLVVPASFDGVPVRSVADRAFERCTAVSVLLPEGITAIGWFAFYDCSALHDVNLPASVTSIGYGAFDASPRVTIVCSDGTFAAQYAASYGIPCVHP